MSTVLTARFLSTKMITAFEVIMRSALHTRYLLQLVREACRRNSIDESVLGQPLQHM